MLSKHLHTWQKLQRSFLKDSKWGSGNHLTTRESPGGPTVRRALMKRQLMHYLQKTGTKQQQQEFHLHVKSPVALSTFTNLGFFPFVPLGINTQKPKLHSSHSKGNFHEHFRNIIKKGILLNSPQVQSWISFESDNAYQSHCGALGENPLAALHYFKKMDLRKLARQMLTI